MNVIVRLPRPRSGDSQGQERFLAPSADKQTRIFYLPVSFIYIVFVYKIYIYTHTHTHTRIYSVIYLYHRLLLARSKN